jgi:hypothetical protein
VARVGDQPTLDRVGIGFEVMPTEQYHEPPGELPEDVRTYARLCTSLIEEAEAINWYAQRLAVEGDSEAAAIMRDAQDEEFKHFSMDLEYLLRRTPIWREVAQRVLFQPGDIVENGDAAEAAFEAGAADEDGAGAPRAGGSDGSLGIGSLKGRER